MGFFRMGSTLAVFKVDGTSPDDKDLLIRKVMKGSRSLEIDWNNADGMGSSGQVVGLLDLIS